MASSSAGGSSLIFVVLIAAAIAVYFFVLKKKNTEPPFNFKKKIKKQDKFTNIRSISRFGDDLNKLTRYPDGTSVSASYAPFLTYPKIPLSDGTTLDIYEKTFMAIASMYMLSVIFSMSTNSQGLFVDLTKKPDPTQKDFDDVFKQFSVAEKAGVIRVAAFTVLSIGEWLQPVIDVCKSGVSPTPLFVIETDCPGIKGFCKFIEYTLNVDLLNDRASIGNGWSEYSLGDTKLGKKGSSQVSISPEITFDTRLIKAIAIQYRGSEVGFRLPPGVTKLNDMINSGISTVNVTVSGSKIPTNTVIKNNTSFFDNPASLNYNVIVLPLNYPTTLTALKITLNTNNSTGATIADGKILIVYD